MQKFRTPLLCFFLSVEFILYILILTTGGSTLVWSSYSAIVLCFLFALSGVNKENRLLILGLFFTVLADFCLVVCDPIQQLSGMIFFVFAQICYRRYLHRKAPNKLTLWIRFVLSIVAVIVCFAVLQENTDALAAISVFYYIHLIMNIVDSVLRRKTEPLLPYAFILFLLCDTVIGLQVMSTGYLPIPEGSILHNILFSGFNLSWLFYLPSQVLIALGTRKRL